MWISFLYAKTVIYTIWTKMVLHQLQLGICNPNSHIGFVINEVSIATVFQPACPWCNKKLNVCNLFWCHLIWGPEWFQHNFDYSMEETTEWLLFWNAQLWYTQFLFVSPSQEDAAMQSCIYSCSPLNVVDLIVDIMFVIDILINFRCESGTRKQSKRSSGDMSPRIYLFPQDNIRKLQWRGG